MSKDDVRFFVDCAMGTYHSLNNPDRIRLLICAADILPDEEAEKFSKQAYLVREAERQQMTFLENLWKEPVS